MGITSGSRCSAEIRARAAAASSGVRAVRAEVARRVAWCFARMRSRREDFAAVAEAFDCG